MYSEKTQTADTIRERKNDNAAQGGEKENRENGTAGGLVALSLRADILTAKLSCELDHHSARPIREEIDRAVRAEKPKTLMIDFSAVHFMDSSGIGLILGRLSLCDEIGCLVRVTGLSPTLLRIVRLTGMEKLSHLTILAAEPLSEKIKREKKEEYEGTN